MLPSVGDGMEGNGSGSLAGAGAPSADLAVTIQSGVGADSEDLGGVDVTALLTQDGASRYAEGPLLGRGGMGEVRLCTDRRIGRDIARKCVRSDQADTPEARARFLREAMFQGRLEHPAVVPVYDLGVDPEGDLFFTMRRVRGLTLQDVLKLLVSGDAEVTARWSRRKLLTAFTAVCLAVHYAHCQGVIHRDLKPANIMLGDFGEVYVIDWGLARRLADHPPGDGDTVEGPSEVTAAGRVMGSLRYMAPEQFAGDSAALDARADVYALGGILFEILTRQPLLQADSLVDAFGKLAHGLDVVPSHRVGDIPPELDSLCARALAFDRNHRLASARVLAEAVEKFLDGELDVTYRRGLAAEHASAAEAALAKAVAQGTPAHESHDARVGAMRALTTALALDPESVDARRALVRLLTTEPDTAPPEAEAAMAEAARAARVHAIRIGARFYSLWIPCIPVVISLGIRNWWAMGPSFALVVATVALAVFSAVTRRVTSRRAVALLVLSSAAIATFSCWLGPFVLLPVAAAVNIMAFALHATRRERPIVALVAILASTVPFVLQLTGILPPAWAFRDGALVLLPRAVSLHPVPTIASLLYISVSLAVLPVWYVASVRDALTAAERKLFLRAWQLRQLVPDAQPAATEAVPPGE